MDETTTTTTVITTVMIAIAIHRRQIYRRRQNKAKRVWKWRPSYEYNHTSFCLDLIPPGKARVLFRFTVPEIIQLAPLLHLYEVEYRDRITCEPTTALCIVCARLSYPTRWYTLADIFGRSPTWLSIVFNDTITFLCRKFSQHLRWHRILTDYNRLEAYAKAVEAVGGVQGVYGFVDGTFKGHRRPRGQLEQRAVYSGHKRAHGMNWQVLTVADGLSPSCIGPYAGANNDWSMWRRSGCEAEIRRVMVGKEMLYIYGDPAYNAAYGIACPYQHHLGRHYLTPSQRAFNRTLSTVRIRVEQTFGDIQVNWTYTAFSKALTAGWQPVAAHFMTAVLLMNCFICLRKRENRFCIDPINVEEYLYEL